MDSYIFGALGLKRNEVAASAKTGGGDGDGDTGEDETSCNAREGWWSQLCANKHLTEGENFKRVRKAREVAQEYPLQLCPAWPLLPWLSSQHLAHVVTNAHS